MRLMIASDIHGSASQSSLLKGRAAALKPDLIILLGDLLYHGPRNSLPDHYSPAEVTGILADLGRPVAAIRGNCDAEVDQMVLPFPLAETAWLLGDGHRIMAIHGHQLEMNGGPLKITGAEAILSGHTHVPTAEQRDGLHYWNPGSASLPKGGFPPSFGFYADGQFKVMSFDDQVLMSDSF